MMGGAAEAPRPRGEKDARNLTVDFTKLDMATLKRYKRHYRLKTRQNVTKTELALAVAKHVAHEHAWPRLAAIFCVLLPRTGSDLAARCLITALVGWWAWLRFFVSFFETYKSSCGGAAPARATSK